MRWTDFCHLTSSYQYPRIVGSLCIERLRARAIEEPPVPRQCDSLRRAARPVLRVDRRDGRFLPVVMRARLASDTLVASPRDSQRSRVTGS